MRKTLSEIALERKKMKEEGATEILGKKILDP